MPLEFRGDAICLSGLTGTKLKCDVIGAYYPFWWRITSGGESKYNVFPTAIVELNAGTGEVYVEDTGQTILGSAGHALTLKMRDSFATRNLKLFLIEENSECYAHPKRVIGRRWPNLSIDEIEGPIHPNSSNVYLLNETLDDALSSIQELKIGNALYFFDPLRNVQFPSIENVARNRITTFYRKGTEFLIFVFTSDWFLGRDDFVSLPTTSIPEEWTDEEAETVMNADFLFGDVKWRSHLLNNHSLVEKQNTLINLYRKRLHKWFRHALPMPFSPRTGQIFHLVLCSNYSTGVRATRTFFCNRTNNPKYTPNNRRAFQSFRIHHPDCFKGIKGRKRPLEWRILWQVIRDHAEGICDCSCKDLKDIVSNRAARGRILQWLEKNGYIGMIETNHLWDDPIVQYRIDWAALQRELDVAPPQKLLPLHPEDM